MENIYKTGQLTFFLKPMEEDNVWVTGLGFS